MHIIAYCQGIGGVGDGNGVLVLHHHGGVGGVIVAVANGVGVCVGDGVTVRTGVGVCVLVGLGV